MGLDYERRASLNFTRANEEIANEIKAFIAEHAAKGMLQSGGTAKRALAVYEQHSSAALAKSLEEMGKLIEHRGRKWRRAAQSIGRALDRQIEEANEILAKPLGFAGATGESDAGKAVSRRLKEVGGRLQVQLDEFVEGWTAPRPKEWKERHPYLDRILFLIIGAAITWGASVFLN